MTADEALDQITAILDGPIGHGLDQAAVWYSKLCQIQQIIDQYQTT